MNYFHRYKRIFASDLIKVDKKNKNIKFNNDRANQLNKIEKVVNEKPIVVNVPKEKKRVTKEENVLNYKDNINPRPVVPQKLGLNAHGIESYKKAIVEFKSMILFQRYKVLFKKYKANLKSIRFYLKIIRGFKKA